MACPRRLAGVSDGGREALASQSCVFYGVPTRNQGLIAATDGSPLYSAGMNATWNIFDGRLELERTENGSDIFLGERLGQPDGSTVQFLGWRSNENGWIIPFTQVTVHQAE